MRQNVVLAACASAALAGCVNPYTKFYQAAPEQVQRQVSQRRLRPPPTTPELFRGNNPRADLEALYGDGYVLVGQSHFEGPKLSSDQALEQGREVGADRVLIYGTLSSEEHTALPLTLPTTQTSVTNGSSTVYGTGGSATAYGTATTTTYGSQTMLLPMTIRRYEGLALYLVKEKFSLGVRYRNLNADESKVTGSVNGVALITVVRGSPAATAGLLPGDLVTNIDGTPVVDQQELTDYLATRQGQAVTLHLYRNGAAKDVNLTLATY